LATIFHWQILAAPLQRFRGCQYLAVEMAANTEPVTTYRKL
jgi:hypothetical protein